MEVAAAEATTAAAAAAATPPVVVVVVNYNSCFKGNVNICACNNTKFLYICLAFFLVIFAATHSSVKWHTATQTC